MSSRVFVSSSTGANLSEEIAVARTRAVIAAAIEQRLFPAAVAEVGDARSVLWREAFGTLTFAPDAPATEPDTIFDLASLTKPLATTTLALNLGTQGALRLDERISTHFPDWRGSDRDHVTVKDLLEHCGGLAPRLLDPPPATRREFAHDIATMPLEYVPRSTSVYSDLGFILLGFLIAERGQRPLARQFDDVFARVTSTTRHDADAALLFFGVPPALIARTAPTRPLEEDARRGRILVGEVHDSYAALLGGQAGHAGLFGTSAAVGAFARACLRAARGDTTIPAPLSPALVNIATTKSAVPGSSRALGWDTMLPTSSCGAKMSPAAFGHVGFTGVSLWIDPILDRYFVLLTNRAGGGGSSDELQTVRRAFHDALAGG